MKTAIYSGFAVTILYSCATPSIEENIKSALEKQVKLPVTEVQVGDTVLVNSLKDVRKFFTSELSHLENRGSFSVLIRTKQKRELQKLVLPSGIDFDKQNYSVQTDRINSIFSSIPLLSKDLDKIKSGEPINYDQFSARVSPAGFKPATAGAEIQCAIQLRHEPKKEDV